VSAPAPQPDPEPQADREVQPGRASRAERDADLGASPQLLFTTNPGLEDIVASELKHRVRAAGLPAGKAILRPFGYGGHVLVRFDELAPETTAAALAMRSVHHVIRPLYTFPLPGPGPDSLEVIAGQLAGRGVDDLEGAATFRVTTKRSGEHGFTSLDVQRAAGAALVQRHGVAVDLTSFDIEVRVDVFKQTCLVGLQLTGAPLSHRHERRYGPRAALKANVAYALVHMAGLFGRPGPLLDPFCGSGTILLEAAQVHGALALEGSDIDPEAVAGTRVNLTAAGLAHRVQLRCCDARHLDAHYPAGHFGAIVTNPPFGIRLGRHLDFRALYRQFLEQAAGALRPGGRLVLIAWKRGVVDRVNREQGLFAQRHVRVVETGGIYPRAYVFDRL